MKSSVWGGGEGAQFTEAAFESANHSEGEHQLVRFFPTRGRENEKRRGGQVHMKAVEINTVCLPSSNRYVRFPLFFFGRLRHDAPSSSVSVRVSVRLWWVCQINRLKRETVGLTGQDFGLCV